MTYDDQERISLTNLEQPLVPLEGTTDLDDILAERIVLEVLAGAGPSGLTELQILVISSRMFDLVKAEVMAAQLEWETANG